MSVRLRVTGCAVAGAIAICVSVVAYRTAQSAARYHRAMNLSEDVGDLSSLFRVRFNSWPTSLEEIESHLPRDEAQRLASRQKLESVSFLFEPKERDLSLSVRIDGKPAWTSTIEPVPQRTPRVRTDATKAFP